MLRFLFAGLVTVSGITALFVGSFGDPLAMLKSSLPQTVQPAAIRPAPPTPQFESLSSNDVTVTAEKNDALRLQIEELQKQMTQAQEQAATQLSTLPNVNVQQSDLGNVPQSDAAQQNENMRKQIQELQAQLAQATVNVDKVHAQILAMARDADLARQAVTAMRRAKDEEAAKRAKDEEAATTKRAKDEEAAKRAKDEEAAAKRAKDEDEAKREVVKAKKPPQQKDSREAMLARLRARFVDADEHRSPEMADLSPLPRQRLMEARAAVVDGRITDAEKLLQQAQTQMILQPVGPSQDVASASNPAAGRIAQALNMLNASDLPRALYYIDMAVTQVDRSLPPR